MVTKLSGDLGYFKVKCWNMQENKQTTCLLVIPMYYFSDQETNLTLCSLTNTWGGIEFMGL